MDILELIGKYIPWVATVGIVIGCFVQVSKIEINPWRWLSHGISDFITKDLNEKLERNERERIAQDKAIMEAIEALHKRMDENQHKEDKRYVKQLRMRIIDFAGSIRNGKINSREAFEEIMRTYSDYHEILEELGESNGYIDTEYELIKEAFLELSKSHDID